MPEATSKSHNGSRANNKRSARQRPLPPNVVARNLAIEKQRREALNEDFRVGFPYWIVDIFNRASAEKYNQIGSGSPRASYDFCTTNF